MQVHRHPVRARLLAMGAAVASVAGLAVVTAPASSATNTETGVVTFVADGDTIDVDVAGDGTSRPIRVRITGIQAMELSVYSSDPSKIRGECWGPDATARLTELVAGRTVRLTSRLRSSNSRGRELRSVAYRSGGSWVDAGRKLIAEGLVIPDANKVEYAKNKDYMSTAQWAAAHRRGMYGNPTHCGQGPSQDQRLQVSVKWKGGAKVNGEYFKIANHGTQTVSLTRWWVRDNGLRRYTLPSWAQVKPGSAVYVHPGKGKNTATHFYWGLKAAIFEDVSSSPKYLGDGGYLFDPQGDLRGWQQYPCRWNCPKPKKK